jgi:hypothetical protein
MKTTYLLLALTFLFTSCNWFDSENKADDSTTLGGSTSIPINTVGNTFTNSVRVGTSTYSGSISITKLENGVATVKVVGKIPSGYPILDKIKSKYKDTAGNLVYEGKFKMTDEGILDYNNANGDPFVLIKYDANVGDKYTHKKSDGTTVVREVVRKSTTDDYYWGGMLIKTIDVDVKVNVPGVSKITYFSNHKFGLVAVRVTMEDGSAPQLSLAPTKY